MPAVSREVWEDPAELLRANHLIDVLPKLSPADDEDSIYERAGDGANAYLRRRQEDSDVISQIRVDCT